MQVWVQVGVELPMGYLCHALHREWIYDTFQVVDNAIRPQGYDSKTTRRYHVPRQPPTQVDLVYLLTPADHRLW
jgi:hypothetical protein